MQLFFVATHFSNRSLQSHLERARTVKLTVASNVPGVTNVSVRCGLHVVRHFIKSADDAFRPSTFTPDKIISGKHMNFMQT